MNFFFEHIKALTLSSCREHSLLTLDPIELKQPESRWHTGCLLRRNPDMEESPICCLGITWQTQQYTGRREWQTKGVSSCRGKPLKKQEPELDDDNNDDDDDDGDGEKC